MRQLLRDASDEEDLTLEQGMNKISVNFLRGKYPEITDRELFIYHHVLDYEERTKYLKTGKMPMNGLRAHIIQDLDVLLTGGSFEGTSGGGREEKGEESVVSPEAEKSEQDRTEERAGKHKRKRRKQGRRNKPRR